MLLYTPKTLDPALNLAREEYLLTTVKEPVVMFWRNSQSVIIGRNQNAYAEIDADFTERNGIAVIRRLTGGGAVFHDPGNLNYSFILPAGEGAAALDFGRFCRPVTEALRLLGAPAEISGRNDITVDGKKISGTAQCVLNGALLHHGTLLFSSDISKMEGALRVDPEKMKAKGIKSVRSRVGNLSEYLPEIADASELARRLCEILTSPGGGFENAAAAEESAEQTAGIEKLKAEKYGTWEWNFGKSRSFSKTVSAHFSFGRVTVGFDSDGGVITAASVDGDFFGTAPVSELSEILVGTRLGREALLSALGGRSGKFISGACDEDIVSLLLGGMKIER